MEKRGQIWVETVVYTLIGLAIIAMLVAVAKPKINQMTEKAVITQTMESLNTLNEQIFDTITASGNQREITLLIKKGEYFIDSPNDNIYFILRDSSYKYSQPNISFKQGDIYVLTHDKGNKEYDIYLMLNYSSFNITYFNKDVNKTLTSAPSAYTLLVQNLGNKQINLETI
jgi:type II secretory pathway pseudopilin PulG